MAEGGAVALGVDLPIGLPRAYAATRPEPDFPTFLRDVGSLPDFFSVCTTVGRHSAGASILSGPWHRRDDPSLARACARPIRRVGSFQSMRPGNGGAAGRGAVVLDTGREPVREGRDRRLETDDPAGTDRNRTKLRLWPFEGSFRSLLAPGWMALAETYPAEALRHLGIRLRGSKRRHADRCATAGVLATAMDQQGAAPDDAMRQAILDGFGADANGEDRFDSVLGVLCVLNVLAGNRPDTAPADPWIQRWEGWVLGQTAMPSGWLAVSDQLSAEAKVRAP